MQNLTDKHFQNHFSSNSKEMKFIECPRDAMQGIGTFIPTDKKITIATKILKLISFSKNFKIINPVIIDGRQILKNFISSL